MSLKSVIDIHVNDSEFQRFQAMFDKYKASLDSAPGVWQKTAEEASGVAAAATKAATASSAQAKSAHDIIVLQSTATRQASTQAGFWSRMAKDSGKFALHIADATRSLLRWGALTGLVSGILGVGGLFGIERLALSAGNQRAQGFALGLKPGEAKAFETNLGSRGYDANAFLGNINTGLLKTGSDQDLALRSIGENTLGKDTNTVAIETLTKLKQFVDKIPIEGANRGVFEHMVGANRLDKLMSMEDIIRLRNTPAAEVNEYADRIRKDQQTITITGQTAKAWADLNTQLTRAGNQLDAVLIKRLTDLAPQIDHLSSAFVKAVDTLLSQPQLKDWIDALANGIKWLADFIGTDEFRQDIISFVKGVGQVASAIKDLVEAFADGVTAVRGWFKNGLDIQKGGVNGPIEDDNPNAPGSDAFYKAHPEIKRPDWNPMHWLFPGSYNEPRGIRNNNPLNISYAPGQGAIGSDSRFGIFGSMEEGIAASERQLLKYQTTGFDTISKIINRWAPPSENDTASYIAGVSKATGIDPNAHLDLNDPKISSALVSAMIKRETGRYLDEGTVQRGVQQGISTSPYRTAASMVPNSGKPTSVDIRIFNQTGGNAYVSASQLAV